MGRVEGVGGQAGGGLNYPPVVTQWYCAFSGIHKWPQCKGEAEGFVGSSLPARAALLMPLIGFTDPIVHFRGLTDSEKAVCKSRLGHLEPYDWCVWVVLECSHNVML